MPTFADWALRIHAEATYCLESCPDCKRVALIKDHDAATAGYLAQHVFEGHMPNTTPRLRQRATFRHLAQTASMWIAGVGEQWQPQQLNPAKGHVPESRETCTKPFS